MTCTCSSSSKALHSMIGRHLQREPDSYTERQAYTPGDRHIHRGTGAYSEGRPSTKKRRRTFEKRFEQSNTVCSHRDPVAIGNFLVAEGRVSHR
jgi:hypothetical protein